MSTSFPGEVRGPRRRGTCGHTPATTPLPGKRRQGAGSSAREVLARGAVSEKRAATRTQRPPRGVRTPALPCVKSSAALLLPSLWHFVVKDKSWDSP